MKKAPTNTTEQVNRDPLGFLLSALDRGSSGAIEEQEAQGQREFTASDTLPSEIKPDQSALEQLGFKFLGPVNGDPLFQYVTFPEGWTKRPTDHSMWTDLLDPKGRKRGAIFYKAAFYDRKASMHLHLRYAYQKDYRDTGDVTPYQITDCDAAIETLPILTKEGAPRWEVDELNRLEAAKVLTERFPDWQNPAAYWD